MQEGLWFSLGCAASQVCDVALSIKAWHQTVTLDPHVRPGYFVCWVWYFSGRCGFSMQRRGITWLVHTSRKRTSECHPNYSFPSPHLKLSSLARLSCTHAHGRRSLIEGDRSEKEIAQRRRLLREGDHSEKEIAQRRRSLREGDRSEKEIAQRRRLLREGDRSEKEIAQRRRSLREGDHS